MIVLALQSYSWAALRTDGSFCPGRYRPAAIFRSMSDRMAMYFFTFLLPFPVNTARLAAMQPICIGTVLKNCDFSYR